MNTQDFKRAAAFCDNSSLSVFKKVFGNTQDAKNNWTGFKNNGYNFLWFLFSLKPDGQQKLISYIEQNF